VLALRSARVRDRLSKEYVIPLVTVRSSMPATSSRRPATSRRLESGFISQTLGARSLTTLGASTVGWRFYRFDRLAAFA
jgi:hypothetical protein